MKIFIPNSKIEIAIQHHQQAIDSDAEIWKFCETTVHNHESENPLLIKIKKVNVVDSDTLLVKYSDYNEDDPTKINKHLVIDVYNR